MHSTLEFVTYCRYYEYTFKGELAANGLTVVSPDNLKVILLKTTVFNIPDLRSMAPTQTRLDTCLVYTATFQQYMPLLCSSTTQYDKAHQAMPHTIRKNAVSVHHTEMSTDCGPYQTEETDLVIDEPDFDLDQPLYIYAFATQESRPPTHNTPMDPLICFPNYIYFQLSTDKQRAWN